MSAQASQCKGVCDGTVALADHRIGDDGKAPEAGCAEAFPALEAKDGKAEAPWFACPPGRLPTGKSCCPGPPGAPVRTDSTQPTPRSCADISCKNLTKAGSIMHRAARGGAGSHESGMALRPGAAAALLPLGTAL